MCKQSKTIKERLSDCLQVQYGLIIDTMEFLPLGLDYDAEVYRVVTKYGDSYLVKLKSTILYEPSLYIPSLLHDQGLTSVVAPVPTNSKTLYAQLDNRTVLIYPFIEGDSSWPGMTNEHWRRVGITFKKVHKTALPLSVCEILRKENFDSALYTNSLQNLESQHIRGRISNSDLENSLRSAWIAHQSTINNVVGSLEKLASTLRERSFSLVICHADLHPANVLRNSAGDVFIVDWDEVMLAPKERDFVFLNEASFYGLTDGSMTSFLQGYGPAEIDWTLLTYYKFERAIQDLIAYAEQVICKDDSSGEKTKANAVQAFIGVFEEGGEIAAAYSAAEHLPSDIIKQILIP